MNKVTRKALEESIAHWRRMREFKLEDYRSPPEYPGMRDCALCQLFHDEACLGCPVSEHTGHLYCHHTPFYTANDAFCHAVDEPSLFTKAAWRRAAKREIEFLESLLEEADK